MYIEAGTMSAKIRVPFDLESRIMRAIRLNEYI